MSKLNLEIISPTGVVFKGQCAMAVVPSAAGEIGVMQGHESVIASLKEGQVKVYDDKQNIVKTFDIVSGYAEMHGDDKLLVLLDS